MDDKLTIWVLGASRGIGAAIAHALTKHFVILSARSETHLLKTLATADSYDFRCYKCDVTNLPEVTKVHQNIQRDQGNVDVLVYSAGIGTFAPFMELTSSDFDKHYAVNVRGLFHAAQLVLPNMISRGQGHIININSVAAFEPFANCTVYGASKAASRAMLRSLRTEVRSHGVNITDVYVGATETEIWPSEARAQNAHRMMQPEDVASVVASIIETRNSPRLQLEEIILRPQGGDL
jgi:short-subunit dehydrogenase